MRRKEMLIGVFCGAVGAILAMAGGAVLPLGAQDDVKDAEFGTINCTGIKIANSNDDYSTMLIPSGISMYSSEGLGVHIMSSGKSGYLSLGRSVTISGGSRDVGGSISVSGENGAVEMEVDEHGGMVRVSGKDGEKAASMVISEYGGRFGVFGKDGKGVESANIAIDEYGGTVSVFGWGSNYSRARMGVNEDGNGAIKTWDKNGYRLATLK